MGTLFQPDRYRLVRYEPAALGTTADGRAGFARLSSGIPERTPSAGASP
jgi:hypothetical protein